MFFLFKLTGQKYSHQKGDIRIIQQLTNSWQNVTFVTAWKCCRRKLSDI